jgi:hypothetical protein
VVGEGCCAIKHGPAHRVENLDRLAVPTVEILCPAGAVTITQALGRVLAAETDVPAFERAGVDGFAARAADTIGAGDPAPCGFCSMRSRARHLPGSVETIEATGVELRAGGERKVRAAPQTESLGIGEIVDRRCLPDPRFTSTSPSNRRVFNSTIARSERMEAGL